MEITVREFKQMSRDEFMDAMLAELEEKARQPGLSDVRRKRLHEEIAQAKEELAEERQRELAMREAA